MFEKIKKLFYPFLALLINKVTPILYGMLQITIILSNLYQTCIKLVLILYQSCINLNLFYEITIN